MSTLFTLSKSWHESTWLFEQLGFAATGDTILLTQDAVLAVHSPITLGSFLAKCDSSGIQVCALSEDCIMRGVDNKYASLKLIDYCGFVDLSIQHSKQVAW